MHRQGGVRGDRGRILNSWRVALELVLDCLEKAVRYACGQNAKRGQLGQGHASQGLVARFDDRMDLKKKKLGA